MRNRPSPFHRFAGVLVVVTMLALLPAAGLRAGEGQAAPLPSLSAQVTVKPMEGRAGAYLCRAVVKDLGTGQVLAAPSLVVPAGEEVEAESTPPERDFVVLLTISIDPASASATYAVSLRRGEAVTPVHEATLALR